MDTPTRSVGSSECDLPAEQGTLGFDRHGRLSRVEIPTQFMPGYPSPTRELNIEHAPGGQSFLQPLVNRLGRDAQDRRELIHTAGELDGLPQRIPLGIMFAHGAQVNLRLIVKVNPQCMDYTTFGCYVRWMARTNSDISAIGLAIQARLRTLRKTQAWLAEQVGVSTNAVSKWMRSDKISRQNAIRVADALAISVDDLLGNVAKPEARERTVSYTPRAVAAGPPAGGLDPFAEVVSQLNDDNRARLFRFALELFKEQPPASTKDAEKGAA